MPVHTRTTATNRSGKHVLQAVKIDDQSLFDAANGLVTYIVIEPARFRASSSSSERRGGFRRRTRLRSAKIVDLDHRFVIECLVYDRSPGGARLRLVGDVAVPQRFRVYDDETETFSTARVAWRQARNIGIRFTAEAADKGISDVSAAATYKRYYAVNR